VDSNRFAGELRTIASTVASGGSLARWREAMGPQDVIVLIDDCGNMQIFVGIDATTTTVFVCFAHCSMADLQARS
jgi:hypothetical protein